MDIPERLAFAQFKGKDPRKRDFVDFLEIRDREVLAGWCVKNSLESMDKDKVMKALEILKDVSETLRSFPSAELYKANLRDWMSLKLPLIFGAF